MGLDRHAVEQLSPLRDGPGAERERERVLLQSPHCRLIADPMSLAAPDTVIDLRRIRKLSETVTHDWVDEEDVTKGAETSPRTTSAEDERTTGEQAVSLVIYFRFCFNIILRYEIAERERKKRAGLGFASRVTQDAVLVVERRYDFYFARAKEGNGRKF